MIRLQGEACKIDVGTYQIRKAKIHILFAGILFVAIFLMSIPPGCKEKPVSETVGRKIKGYAIYDGKSEKFDFTFEYPSNWVQNEDSSAVFINGPQTLSHFAILTVEVRKTENKRSGGEIIEDYLEKRLRLRAKLSVAWQRKLFDKPAVLDRAQGREFNFLYKGKDKEDPVAQEVRVIVIRNKKIYEISYGADAEWFGKYYPVYERAKKNLQIQRLGPV